MSQTAPNSITALPTPPSTLDPTNFDTRADAFLAQLPTLVGEINSANVITYNNAVDAYNNSVTVASNATSAAANAAIAATSAGATLWVSGTTYAIGDRRYSPANGLTYRRLTAGAGTTDPSADTTNWTPIGLNAPAQLITANIVTAISGQCLALSNSTAQGSATNLCDYSAYNAGTWSNVFPSTATVTTGIDDPMGGGTAVRFATNGSGQSLFRVAIPAFTPNGTDTYTVSFWARLVSGSGTPTADLTDNQPSGAYASQLVPGQWTRVVLTGTPSAGIKVCVDIFNNVPLTITLDYWGLQVEKGSTATSNITTTGTIATRSAGVVAPQRVVLPANPSANAWVKVVVANGVATNVIDPNGEQFKGANGIVSGPIELDNIGFSGALQFIDGYWRFV